MKKFISLITALSLTSACGICAMAADRENAEPDVIVDGSKIIFEDRNAKIIDDVTLVPARGVFEAMGCKVVWNEKNRTVTVTSATGVRVVVITIDSDVMEISTFKTLMEKDSTDYKLEVPAQIIDDRTMIPLRAVSEAFDCEVEWDEAAYAVNITTGDPILLEGYTYTAPAEDSLVKMSLSTDKEGALEVGEEFSVYVNVENMPENSYLSGIVAAFEYDDSKFEYVEGGTMLDNNDEGFKSTVKAENADYKTGAKIAFVMIDTTKARTDDGRVFKATFKSVNGESGVIKLSNDFESVIGYESYLMFNANNKDIIYNGKNLVIGEPLTIGE